MERMIFEIDETVGFEPFVAWFHVLPLGEFYFKGRKIDLKLEDLNNIDKMYKKLASYGDKPTILVGIHSGDNEVKTKKGVGFVIDSRIVFQHEKVSPGLWMKLEVRNKEIANRLQTKEIDGISAGLYELTDYEIPATGEKVSGLYINHVTLTNEPHLSWLDSHVMELNNNKFNNIVKTVLNAIAPLHYAENSVIPLQKHNFKEEENMDFEKVIQERDTKIADLEKKLEEAKETTTELEKKLEDYEKKEKELEFEKITSKIDELVKNGQIVPDESDSMKSAMKELEFDKAMSVLNSISNIPIADLDKSIQGNNKNDMVSYMKKQSGIKGDK
jgi:hypothetical protein